MYYFQRFQKIARDLKIFQETSNNFEGFTKISKDFRGVRDSK